jgi:hypothetical protein
VERSGTSGKTLNFSHEWKKSQIFNKDECKYLFLPFQLKNKACRFHSFIRMSMSIKVEGEYVSFMISCIFCYRRYCMLWRHLAQPPLWVSWDIVRLLTIEKTRKHNTKSIYLSFDTMASLWFNNNQLKLFCHFHWPKGETIILKTLRSLDTNIITTHKTKDRATTIYGDVFISFA